MKRLHFPSYKFRLKSRENKLFIFDDIRKKFVRLSPEEWVRQHVARYLVREKNYPASHINAEKELELYGTKKRYDLVVYNADTTIRLIVECKAPSVQITQEAFDQIARYNLELDAEYLMLTNGLEHYYCQMDYGAQRYSFLRELPAYGSH